MKNLNLTLVFLLCILFVNIVSAQTVKQRQKTEKKYHNQNIKTLNTKDNNLIKVQVESISVDSIDHIKENQIISNQNTQSPQVKMITPTTVVPNTTKSKEINLSNSKYQRKKTKIKVVKDE